VGAAMVGGHGLGGLGVLEDGGVHRIVNVEAADEPTFGSDKKRQGFCRSADVLGALTS